jgi:NADH-quinone oxidoreductase subunit H
VLNFILKATFGVTVMMWVRWTLPRLRIDQVMVTCLKYCVPLAAFCFVGAMIWKLDEWPTINNLARLHGQPLAHVREDWVLGQGSEFGVQGSEAKFQVPSSKLQVKRAPAEVGENTSSRDLKTLTPALSQRQRESSIVTSDLSQEGIR